MKKPSKESIVLKYRMANKSLSSLSSLAMAVRIMLWFALGISVVVSVYNFFVRSRSYFNEATTFDIVTPICFLSAAFTVRIIYSILLYFSARANEKYFYYRDMYGDPIDERQKNNKHRKIGDRGSEQEYDYDDDYVE